jgi:hypothetical protein
MNAFEIRQHSGSQVQPLSAWSSPPHPGLVRAPP